jgi:uncharacterized protein (DUF3084 family)
MIQRQRLTRIQKESLILVFFLLISAGAIWHSGNRLKAAREKEAKLDNLIGSCNLERNLQKIEIKKRDSIIGVRNTAIRTKDDKIQEQNQTIATKDAEIQTKIGTITRLEKENEQLNKVLNRKPIPEMRPVKPNKLPPGFDDYH